LLRSEYRAIVLWIDTDIVAIPLFEIDVPSSSKCVGFGSEFSGRKWITRLNPERYLDQHLVDM